jgi:hypothetical protein
VELQHLLKACKDHAPLKEPREMILTTPDCSNLGGLGQTTLEVLDVRENNDITPTDSHFCDLLPQMKGLKAVYGLIPYSNDGTTDAAGFGIVDGLRKMKLRNLFADEDNSLIVRALECYFSSCRTGNRFLSRSESPWPNVAYIVRHSEPPRALASGARQASPRNTSLLTFAEQAKIVKCKAAATESARHALCLVGVDST